MRKIISGALVFCALVSVGAHAGGDGSGNPFNAGGNEVKSTKPPHFIWKDGKLVKNPDYNTEAKKKETVSQK